MTAAVDLAQFGRTVDQVFSLDELRSRLGQGRALRIKYGVDATAPFLHVGHAVNLWLMRYLQDRGHKVMFLIGDFTTRIGDPTGKSRTRREIGPDEIEANAREFLRQVGLVLRTDSEVFEVRRNSEWFGRMGARELLGLVGMVTHARLIQREMFQRRIEAGQDIYVHEMLYPVLQGYDSVMLESDLTIVGSDQLYNEMLGRLYQERFGQEPQVVVTTRITPGLDGVEKQSKSLGNYIALTDPPREKFGKAMSIPDALIAAYLEVYTEVDLAEVRTMAQSMADGRLNPMDAKLRLAEALVNRYHGAEAAASELSWFRSTFSERLVPVDAPVVPVEGGLTVLEVLRRCLPEESNAALRRLVRQGGVRLNDRTLGDLDARVTVGENTVLAVGKRRWFRLEVT